MKRNLALALAITVVISMFGGCQSAASTPAASAPSAGTSQAQPATSAAKDVTLDFYIWDELQAPATQDMIDAFCKENPNIKVELTAIPFDQYIIKMQTTLSTGTGPDICWLNTSLASQYMSTGALEPLTPLIERDKYDYSQLNENIRNGYSYDDTLYAIPKDLDTVVVFYNKELFDRAKVPYPNNNWTWDEFRSTAKALTIDGVQYGYTNNFNERTYYSLIMSNGGTIFNEDRTAATVTTPIVADGIKFLNDMAVVDKSTPTGPEAVESGDRTFFMNNQAALDINGSWVFAGYAEALGDKLGVAELPTGKVGKSSISHGIGYAMPKGGKNVEEAWKLLKFLGTPEAQIFQAKNVIPANNSVSGKWAEQYTEYDLSAVVRALEYSPILPLAAKNPAAVREGLKNAIQEVWLGTSDIPTALAKAEKKMNEEIAK